jgi:peptide/nickel transport system substrate-binding protein
MPDTIVYKVVPNDTTAANLFLTGELDVGEVAASERPRLIASGKFWLGYERSKITTTYLAFNTRRPLLADVTLRTALTMVMSPKTYDTAVNGANSGNVINATFVTPAGDCHDPNAAKLLPQGTVAAARAVLTRRGYTYRGEDLYTPGGDKVSFEFLGSPVTTGVGGEYVVSQWKKLGVDVQLRNLERAIWGGRILVGNFDATVLAFGAAYPSPGSGIGWISGPYPPDGNNLGVPRNAKYEREIELAKQTSGEARCQHWINAARMLVNNRWFIPLFARATPYFVRKGIGYQRWNGEVQELSFRARNPIRP